MTDYQKLFEKHGIEYRTDVNRGWVNINCPYCKPTDTHFNGGFVNGGRTYNCWRCGSHNYLDTLSLILRIPNNVTKKEMERYPYYGETTTVVKKKTNVSSVMWPGKPFTDKERQYLVDRGFDPDYCESVFGLAGGGVAGDWAFRILIPVFLNGRLVSFTGRSIIPKDKLKELGIPRYKNLSIEQSEVNVKDIMFNTDKSKKDSVILVEGPMDVVRMGNDCICSLGTGVTPSQLLFMADRWKTVYVAFDNETEAQRKARHVAGNLSSLGIHAEVVDFLSDFNKNDPGEMTEDEVRIVKQELGLYR